MSAYRLLQWAMTSAISEDQAYSFNKRLADLYKGELSIFRDAYMLSYVGKNLFTSLLPLKLDG
ncbi:TPA: hypothetical protein ACSP36_001773, partial [Aeromonas hydrophila]